MADRSNIEWTDSTFNPWVGCAKVSPACDHCYAEAMMDTRMGRAKWGPRQQRVRTSPANWRKPLKWNAKGFYQCRDCGWRGDDPIPQDAGGPAECPRCESLMIETARHRVFCASLADVFDNEVPDAWRCDLFDIIRSTPNLDWLLLTKRVGNVTRMLDECGGWSGATAGGGSRRPLPNVWLGATICNQDEADRDIPKLLATPAAVRFVSIEPMLGLVDLTRAWNSETALNGVCPGHHLPVMKGLPRRSLDWVIAGGESGPQARPSHPDWFRSLRDQCAAAGVSFLFKQWGEWIGSDQLAGKRFIHTDETCHDWPNGSYSARIGKKSAGRLLDGRTHDGFPAPNA